MKLLILILLILGSFVSNSGYGQAGFYGRKTVVELGVLARNPFFSNLETTDHPIYTNKNGSLSAGKDKIDYGFSAGVYFLSNRLVSFGIYGSIYKTNAPGFYGPAYTKDDDPIAVSAMQKFDLTSYSFVPMISFSGNQLIKPVGVSSELGLGFATAKLNQKDYLVRTSASYYKEIVDSLNQSGQLYDKNAKYNAVVLMYGLKVRQPLSKRLLLYYGFRYTLHFGFSKDRNVSGLNTYPYSSDYGGSQEYLTSHFLRRNFINFQAGLCFML